MDIRYGLAATLMVLVAMIGCEPGRPAPAEMTRLVPSPPGTLPPAYTLADETRIVLAAPPELRVQLTPGQGKRAALDVTLPTGFRGEEVIAWGLYQVGKQAEALPPRLLTVEKNGLRKPRIMFPLTGLAQTSPELTVVLTPPPPASTVETAVESVTIPQEAELHFGFGISEAAAIEGAAPLALEVVGQEDDGATHSLFSTTLEPGDQEAHSWQERVIPLTHLGGRPLTFIFRTAPAGAGRAVPLTLWADPTIVAESLRPPARRNVILISLDTLRADRVGIYGSYRPTTPAIDAVAAESAVFTNAWAPWPETCGSHMSLFTSRYPSEHGVTNILTTPALSVELLAERLRREGYLTRAFTENGNIWAHAGFARGFSAYAEIRSPDRKYRGEIVETFTNATRWVESHRDRTFFLFVHTYQVHHPYQAPAEYQGLFNQIEPKEPGSAGREALKYDREVRYMDDQVGEFIATLRRLELPERSIVIIMSDHGEEFQEHGGYSHAHSLHRELLHVPLILWAPGLLGPSRVDAPVSLMDLPPTVLELLELAPDPEHRGVSLTKALRGTQPASRPIFGELHDFLTSVRKDGRTAIVDSREAGPRCYAADDPSEQHPTAECPDLVRLIEEHRQSAVPLGNQAAPPIDPRLAQKMRALGYIE